MSALGSEGATELSSFPEGAAATAHLSFSKHLYMVDRPTCIIAAIWSTVTDFDSYKRLTSLTCFSSSFAGRPPFRPRARAAASPARVRSRIRSRSNCARLPKMLNTSVPPGVLVSIDSVSERNCTPFSSNGQDVQAAKRHSMNSYGRHPQYLLQRKDAFGDNCESDYRDGPQPMT